MKVAFSASGQALTSQMDPRFGRCAHFVIVDTDSMSNESVTNDSGQLSGGAGIQSAQLLSSRGVKAVITGNCGPNAVAALSAAGIDLYTGQTGSIEDALARYREGNLTSTREPNVGTHFGIGGGRGMGRGGGGGGGTGRGGGGRR